MNRRTALKLGGSLGLLAGAGLLGGYELLPPGRSRSLESVDVLARRLYTSLTPDQHAETVAPYDHPLRQYHNRGVLGGGRQVMFGFSRNQRQTLTDLLYSGLSEEGRQRIPDEFFTQWTGVQSMQVLICGDPTVPPYQVILTGAHLNLRLGGKSREGAAFGGPQVYGDQRGNEQVGLPGNLYRDQFLMGQRLLQSLDPGRRKLAVIEEAPVQTSIELQGPGGTFPGIPVSELTADGKELVRQTVERICATYHPDDSAYARECLNANGGLNGLFLSYYEHGEDGRIPEAQVFRLEGPAAVFHFRGHPHVHAFINVAMDGNAPLSSGELLGTNPAWLDRPAVKTLFETVMRSRTGADFAYYEINSVAGRLRAGQIRSGDIYSLESWQDTAEVVEIRGMKLSALVLNVLKAQGIAPDRDKIYRIVVPTFVANTPDQLGRIEERTKVGMLRDLTVDYLKAHGFASKNTGLPATPAL